MLPSATGIATAARPHHPRPWYGRRKNGSHQRQTWRGRGVERSRIRDVFWFVSPYISPSFSTYEVQCLRFLPTGPACFTLGGRRGSQGHRAGEASTGPNRWRNDGEHSVARTIVACTSLTAGQRRDTMCTCVLRVAASSAYGTTSYVRGVLRSF